MNRDARTRQILQELGSLATTTRQLPRLLVELCARSLPVSGVGLTLMGDDDTPAGLVAATSGSAVVLEELQFTLGEGPCVDASRAGRPVLVPDLAGASATRPAVHAAVPGADQAGSWPVFTPAALAAGVAAVFAFPLRIGAIRIGVLDLYRDRTGALEHEEVGEALAFAEAATLLLLHLQSTVAPPGDSDGDGADRPGTDDDRPPPELWAIPLVEDRAVVHQATGVVSVTAGVTLAQALVLLRARAFGEGRAVNDVARDVVEGVVRLPILAEGLDGDPGPPGEDADG